jgi:hypothetical protein
MLICGKSVFHRILIGPHWKHYFIVETIQVDIQAYLITHYPMNHHLYFGIAAFAGIIRYIINKLGRIYRGATLVIVLSETSMIGDTIEIDLDPRILDTFNTSDIQFVFKTFLLV